MPDSDSGGGDMGGLFSQPSTTSLDDLLDKGQRANGVGMPVQILTPWLFQFQNDAATTTSFANSQRQQSHKIRHLPWLKRLGRIRVDAGSD